MPLPLFTCRPIGIIHTPHTDPAQTPRQPIHAADFTGQVEIFPEFVAGLEGLEHYVRIWLLFAFHRAEAPRLHVIPHGQTQERGVFTTRAPCRPGGIGMSLVPCLACGHAGWHAIAGHQAPFPRSGQRRPVVTAAL